MRGYQAPSLRNTPSELQTFFTTLSRARQNKLAMAASTTLVKANQWARGEAVAAPIAQALNAAVKAHQATVKPS
jgi:hypothetical protein